jgi:hypothetical protein
MRRNKLVYLIIFTGAGLIARSAFAYLPFYTTPTIDLAVVSTSEIDLSWVAVSSDPATSGYKIERESPIGGGFLTIVANTGSAGTTYADKNLIGGREYNYRISAINSDGVGPASSIFASATTKSPPTFSLPDPPKNLTVTLASSTEIDITWSAPASTAVITGYRIEREVPFGSGFTTLIASTTATSYSDNVTNFPLGLTFNYRVFALGEYGPSISSVSAYATTPTLPEAPRDANAVAGDGQVIISWRPPFFTGGGITSYAITGTPTGTVIIAVPSTTPNAYYQKITGLDNGVSYYFSVTAMNMAGSSQSVLTNTVVPLVTPQPIPVATSSVIATATATETTSTPTTAPVYKFVSILQKGMRGEGVLELQKRLAKEGFFAVSPTGYFGAITETALKAYQRAKGIATVGILGPITRASLNSKY